MKPLCQKEQILRTPLKPEILVDALQDRILVKKGKIRIARTVKINSTSIDSSIDDFKDMENGQ